MLDRFTSADIDVFYATLALGARAKGKRLGTLRRFFRFCMNREWLSTNPVTSDLKPPLGANRSAKKVPFTDDELQSIIRACDRMEATGNEVFLRAKKYGGDVFTWIPDWLRDRLVRRAKERGVRRSDWETLTGWKRSRMVGGAG